MLNSRFGYSMKKNSFKGLNIDCIQYSNIIRITYYSYSYSGTILNPNIIRIRIRPNICARILFVFVFAHSEKTNIIRIRIRSKEQYSLTSGYYVEIKSCCVWSLQGESHGTSKRTKGGMEGTAPSPKSMGGFSKSV